MNYSYPQLVLQEVPGEISLALSISGCPLTCKGCHSSETKDQNYGSLFNENSLIALLEKHKHISCVLFYGGEWFPNELIMYLSMVRARGLKACLYTGLELKFVKQDILNNLDFIKVGKYIESKGGLESKNTNQKFYKLKKGKICKLN